MIENKNNNNKTWGWDGPARTMEEKLSYIGTNVTTNTLPNLRRHTHKDHYQNEGDDSFEFA